MFGSWCSEFLAEQGLHKSLGIAQIRPISDVHTATCRLPGLCTSSMPSLILFGLPIFAQLLGNYILTDFTSYLFNIMGEFQFGYTI